MRLHFGVRVLFVLGLMACCSVGVHAQISPVNPNVLVANPAADDDFLLPSYWTATTPQISPNALQAPTDEDILAAIFGPTSSAQTFSELGSGAIPMAENSSEETRGHTFYPRSKMLVKDGKSEEEESLLLTPLPPIPPKSEPEIAQHKVFIMQSGYVSQLLQQARHQQSDGSTVPRDMRIRFRPNDARLSSQNLKWIKLFATYVLYDPRLVLVVRLSDKNWGLQRARLAIILQVAMESGLSAQQIRVHSSNRDENSIILSYDFDDALTRIQPFQEKTKPIRTHKTLTW